MSISYNNALLLYDMEASYEFVPGLLFPLQG